MSVHLLVAGTTEDDDRARCGAKLLPASTPHELQDWTEERHEVTCGPCGELADEDAFDQSLPEWIGDEEPQWSIDRRAHKAEDAAVDRYVEDHR